MPLERDTLPQLIEKGATEFESRLPGVLARVRNSLVGVLNRVVAGALSTLYKYAEYLNDQVWPDRAAPEFLPLHGARWGKPQLPAAAATGTAGFAGINGSVIALGTVVQRSDAVQYATTAEGVIAAGVANIPVEAVEPGQLGNAVIGTALTLTSPIAGVNAVASAQTALAGGADLEAIEPWRARILSRIRKPPQGGADYDYEGWALEVPGVTRAWVYPGEQGAGTVVVRFVRDDDASIIPDAGEVAAVQAAIDAVRPVTATTYVVAPIATPQNYTIQLLPDSAAIRAAVEAELLALYRRAGKPGGTMLISQEREAISVAAGETDHVLSVPAANQAHTTGQLPMLGVITWV